MVATQICVYGCTQCNVGVAEICVGSCSLIKTEGQAIVKYDDAKVGRDSVEAGQDEDKSKGSES